MHAFIVATFLITIISGCLPPSHCTLIDGVGNYSGGSYNIEDRGANKNIILVHGGTWYMGSKDSAYLYNRSNYLADKLAAYNIYSINYTLWNQSQRTNAHPRQAEDLITFLEQLQGSNILIGYSAGGHIAGHVASTRPDLVAGIVSYAGIFNFTDDFLTTHLDGVSETARMYRDDSLADPGVGPITVPALLLAGGKDGVVSYNQTVQYATRWGLDYKIYPDSSHRAMLFGVCGSETPSEISLDIIRFIESL